MTQAEVPSLASRLARGSGFLLASQVITSILGITTSIALARLLGPTDFGVYSLLAFFIVFLILVGGLGLPSTVQKYTAEYTGSKAVEPLSLLPKWALRVRAATSIPVVAILLASAAYFAIDLSQTTVAAYLAILAVTSALSGFGDIFGAMVAGAQRFDIAAKVSIVGAVISTSLILCALALHTGIIGVLAVGIATSAVSAALNLGASRRLFPAAQKKTHPPIHHEPQRRRWWRYAISILAVGTIDLVVWQRSEIIFLQYFRTSSDVALYSVAYGLAGRLVVYFPAAFLAALFPLMSQLFGGKERDRLSRLYFGSTRLLIIGSIPLGSLGIVLAEPLVRVLYGTVYLSAAAPLRILLVSAVAGSIAGAGSSVVYAVDRPVFIVKFGIFIAGLDIALSLVFIPAYGIIGAATANTIAQLVGVLGGTLFIVRRLGGFVFPVGQLIRSVGAGILASMPALGLALLVAGGEFWPNVTALLLGGASGLVAYPFILATVGGFSAADFVLLRRYLPRLPTPLKRSMNGLADILETIAIRGTSQASRKP